MDYQNKYNKYKHGYKKYKSKYVNNKGLFAFVVEGYNFGTHLIIIVKALDENDAYNELNKLDNTHSPFIYQGQFPTENDFNELKKYIFKENIKPIRIDLPAYFSFYI